MMTENIKLESDRINYLSISKDQNYLFGVDTANKVYLWKFLTPEPMIIFKDSLI